ncbi:transporter substrate-binding domain-containing protein [Noviherbaspirillum galbum]|uniref:Transporter substrate-binding domain-containing protein n=1 Tax=Noviherbaspirillum galbum TaxID=2709383 RepID=A0A6B3SNN2_9BURK|nr:transporter substrate-binding domain-containing protein [Noviherbaspirillum galbum]NEX62337.1 transporter substrate-binding domain-containing protein [Noviherbaspirillum galbum]
MKTPTLASSLLLAGMAAIIPPASGQTLKKIADRNKITVGYRESSVPFSYAISPHKAVGFSVDLTEAIVADVRKATKRPNLENAYLPVTPKNRIPMLVDGTYDLECGSTTNTAERGKEVAFSVSYFYAGTRLLARKASGVKNYADLAGKAVATTAGSTNEKVIRKYGADHNLNFEVVPAKDYAEAFQLVDGGRAAALALDDVLLYGLRANSGNPDAFDVVGEALQVEPYGCMVRKDDPEFKKLVDGTITRLMKSGEFARMYARWFESPIPPKGVVLHMPMNEQLKANIKARSDKPAM